MVDVSFVFWIDSNPALNAYEPDSSTLPDPKNPAQLGRDHQLALRRHHTFKLFHALHFNTKSKTLPGRWPRSIVLALNQTWQGRVDRDRRSYSQVVQPAS